MAETTNQTQKLYGVETSWEVGRITEYEIVKETEKTYIVRAIGEKAPYRGNHTVRKSEMAVYNVKLVANYPDAVELAMQTLRGRIERNNKKIENINADSDKCAALLKEYEEVRNNA